MLNRATETAANASFASSYSDGDGDHLILHSDRRADGVVLEAMIGNQPDSDLIPKLVPTCRRIACRDAGPTPKTTSSCCWRWIARSRPSKKSRPISSPAPGWARISPASTPSAAASTGRHHIDVPMQWLADHSPPGPLLIAKVGPGRLYYRIGMDYAPRSLELAAAQHGFEVERRHKPLRTPPTCSDSAMVAGKSVPAPGSPSN